MSHTHSVGNSQVSAVEGHAVATHLHDSGITCEGSNKQRLFGQEHVAVTHGSGVTCVGNGMQRLLEQEQ
eukprot:11207615-Alexandrium_andersonii.AAC.1